MSKGYKKYMKKDARKSNPLPKIFIVTFFGMLLVFIFAINSLSGKFSADTSVGDYKEQPLVDMEDKKIVDNRLQMIQNEDQDRDFSEIMEKEKEKEKEKTSQNEDIYEPDIEKTPPNTDQSAETQEVVYKVYIGSYTSAEQAKVAKDIIVESGSELNPIVKCIGSNNYTLQVGTFKNKNGAEVMLNTVQQNHLPGRIVQEY